MDTSNKELKKTLKRPHLWGKIEIINPDTSLRCQMRQGQH